MRNMLDKANELSLRGYVKVKSFISCERGDTNFISIILILLLVLVIAGIIFTFLKTNVIETIKTRITEQLNDIFPE